MERIRVVMDRRMADRRQRAVAASGERRQSGCRRHEAVDANLRERGFVILPSRKDGS